MRARLRIPDVSPLAAACAIVGLAGLVIALNVVPYDAYVGRSLIGAGALVVLSVAASVGYVAWNTPPAWLLTGAVVLSPFNSNWGAFGFPGGFAPDRLLLLAALTGLVLRAPPARDRLALRLRPLHVLFAATVLWSIGSGIAAQTMGESESIFFVLDRLVVPMVVFAVAPLVFAEARHREVFLAAMVAMGAYVGLTTFFQAVGPQALVFPRFILDPSVGFHLRFGENRARGPFLEAGVNGMGLFVFAVASAIAVTTWRQPRARLLAGAVLVLCGLGLILTLTRAVWLAAIVATVVTLLAGRQTRRFAVPLLLAGAAAVAAALAIIPNLRDNVSDRQSSQRSVWERKDVDAAAVAMVLERPLLGFGLSTFNRENADFYPLLADTPQVAERRIGVHNVFLLVAVSTGLVGLLLFLASFGVAVGSALLTRGPPELAPWRLGLLAIAVFWLVEANFAPLGHVFADLLPFLWAGIVVAGGARA